MVPAFPLQWGYYRDATVQPKGLFATEASMFNTVNEWGERAI
jgi:hypothetical protein